MIDQKEYCAKEDTEQKTLEILIIRNNVAGNVILKENVFKIKKLQNPFYTTHQKPVSDSGKCHPNENVVGPGFY